MDFEHKGDSKQRIHIDDGGVTLVFEGFTVDPAKKASSPRRIPFTAIERTELTEPGTFRPGYLRLHLAGAPRVETDPQKDPNVIAGLKGKQYDGLVKAAWLVEQRIRDLERVPEPSLSPEAPVAEERKKAASAELRPDIVAAVQRMGTTFGSRREIRKLPELLWEGETVERLASGNYTGKVGIVALTNRRLMFFASGWVSEASEDFPFEKISSVQTSSGFGSGTLTIFASGNKAEISQVQKGELRVLAEIIRNRIHGRAGDQPPSHVAAAERAGDPLDQLRRLGELRDAGLLTAEEFEAKKAELLKRI